MKARAIPATPGSGVHASSAADVTAIRPRRVGRPSSASRAADPLVNEAVATALESLDLIERRAREVARAFRSNRAAEAQHGLRDVMHGVHTVVTLAATAATASGVDLETAGAAPAGEATRAAINELIRCQRTGEWTALAGALEGAFIPALRQWRGTLEWLGDPDDEPTPGGHAA